jgi:hypothetical protein
MVGFFASTAVLHLLNFSSPLSLVKSEKYDRWPGTEKIRPRASTALLRKKHDGLGS